MTENYKYYDGFEGEPEYTFCLYDVNCPIEKTHLWGGYFEDISVLLNLLKQAGQVLLNIIIFVLNWITITGKFLIFIQLYSS